MSTAVQRRNNGNGAVADPKARINDLRAMLERGKGQLQLALAEHMSADRMIRLALTAASKNPALLGCTQESIGLALLTASQLGLEPNGRDAHLVPYGNQCQLIPDYKGLVKLAFQSPRVKRFQAYVVYEHDDFEYQLGTEPRIHHVPTTGERGRLIAAYAVAKIDTADPQFVVLTREDVEKRRSASRSGNRSDSPWSKWEAEMWAKTAAKALAKWLPLGDRLEAAVEHDNQVEAATIDVAFAEPSATADELREQLSAPQPADDDGERCTLDAADAIDAQMEDRDIRGARKSAMLREYGVEATADLTPENAKTLLTRLAQMRGDA